MICGCGFVLWCSVGLFYGGCGFIGSGCAMLALDCVFFFSCSATGVCGCGWWANGGGGESSCGWWADGGVGVCGSVGVGFGSVGGSVGFFFLVLTVDYGFLVVVVLGVCSAAVVVIVVVEQK